MHSRSVVPAQHPKQPESARAYTKHPSFTPHREHSSRAASLDSRCPNENRSVPIPRHAARACHAGRGPTSSSRVVGGSRPATRRKKKACYASARSRSSARVTSCHATEHGCDRHGFRLLPRWGDGRARRVSQAPLSIEGVTGRHFSHDCRRLGHPDTLTSDNMTEGFPAPGRLMRTSSAQRDIPHATKDRPASPDGA